MKQEPPEQQELTKEFAVTMVNEIPKELGERLTDEEVPDVSNAAERSVALAMASARRRSSPEVW